MPGRGRSRSATRADDDRPPAALVRAAGEAVVFVLAFASPWAYGSVEQPFEFVLSAAALVLAALWATHAALTGRFRLRTDVVLVCLGGLAVWSLVQLVPLPEPVVGLVSPARVEWHRTLLPDPLEALPGESAPVPRPAWLPLTVDPSATRTFLARVLGVLVVYAAARNWLATRDSFPRLAWAAVGTGVALAVFALGQLASARPGTVYWTVPSGSDDPFGPFICRNHYPDYLALCVGLGVGLLIPRTLGPGGLTGWLLSPRGLGLAGAVGLMAASVPFSLSRGGVLAGVAAAAGAGLLVRSTGRAGVGLGVAGGIAAVGVGLAGWFGTDPVQDRLATLGTGEASASRVELWRDAARLIPGAWLTGTGNGTFGWTEATVRTRANPEVRFDNAHNEYLEAVVEGGVVRLALTVGLAAGVLVVVGRGYLRRRDRSVGPLLLGAWAGLAALVVHSAVDFGVHIPAVAALAAVVAGYAVAGSVDPSFAPLRRGREEERGRRGEEETKTTRQEAAAGPGSVSSSPLLPLSSSVMIGLLLAGGALFAAVEARSRDRADRLKQAADRAYWDPDTPDRLAARADWLDRRAAARPSDPAVRFDAAQAHIDRAVEATWAPGAGLAGAGAGFAAAPDRVPAAAVGRHLAPGLRHLLAARAANPVFPKPHARLGVYAGYFATSEPAAVHFARAKALLATDPDLWFASGREALSRGDLAAACADWKRSLELAPRHLVPILRLARGKLPPREVIDRVLPADPAVVLAAAGVLAPAGPDRRMFLDAVAARAAGLADPTADQLLAAAAAHDELEDPGRAGDAFRRAVAADPESRAARDRYAAWLEREERYAEALEHLDWLAARGPRGPALADRLDAARRGADLRRRIDGE